MASPLDQMVCFAMYTASHATSQAYREVLSPWELTYTQYIALIALAEQERTVSALSDEMGLDSGTLSPLLRRLEGRGFVERRRDPADERLVRVALTSQGQRVHDEVKDAVGCVFSAFADAGIDPEGVVRQLRDITDQMKKLTAAQRAA